MSESENQNEASIKRVQKEILAPENRLAADNVPFDARLFVWVVMLFLGLGIYWAAVSRVQSQVVTFGVLQPIQGTSPIQAFNRGALKSIHAEVGDRVSRGDALAVIASGILEADLSSTQERILRLQAKLKRVSAEKNFVYPERFSTNAAINEKEKIIFEKNRDDYAASLQFFESEMHELRLKLQQGKLKAEMLEKETELLEEIRDWKEKLYLAEQDRFSREGPRLEEFQRAELVFLERQREVEAGRAQNDVVEVLLEKKIADRNRVEANRQKNLQETISAVEAELALLYIQLQKSKSEIENETLRAPFDGTVVVRQKKALGSFVESGEALFTLVPANAELFAVIDISPINIANVQTGMNARIKLDALPFVEHGDLTARVETISEDIVGETLDGQRGLVFRAWLKITGNNLAATPQNFELRPGMTLEANIESDERTVLHYLLEPVLKGLSRSFKEP